jgi:chaperonin GroES
MKGKVIAGKVLIKPSVAEAKTSGGIYIPESAQETPNQGEVILIGEIIDPKTNVAPTLKVGDKVMYGKYAGTNFEIDGEKYILLAIQDILYIF